LTILTAFGCVDVIILCTLKKTHVAIQQVNIYPCASQALLKTVLFADPINSRRVDLYLETHNSVMLSYLRKCDCVCIENKS